MPSATHALASFAPKSIGAESDASEVPVLESVCPTWAYDEPPRTKSMPSQPQQQPWEPDDDTEVFLYVSRFRINAEGKKVTGTETRWELCETMRMGDLIKEAEVRVRCGAILMSSQNKTENDDA